MAQEKRKVLIIDNVHPYLKNRLEELNFEVEVDRESSLEILETKIPEYFGLVIRSRISLTADFFDKATGLAFVARNGVGVEHIDLEAAARRNITVYTSPEGSRDAVGEHTLGLLLTLMNNLARADRQIRQAQWHREPNRGYEIKGKTVGIIGYGNMGNAFAQRLQGFEAEVIAYDKFKQDYGNAYAVAVDLESIFKQSDIVSLHIPYMLENHHFVNAAFLGQFKKPIYIVNTARGLVLNTSDLVDALKSGKVLGAALDVLEYEESSFEKLNLATPPEPLRYLLEAENTVLSPHVGGWTYESKEGHARVLAAKIEQAFCD